MVASGTKLQTIGYIPQLKMEMQGYKFATEFYLLFLSGCEVILGGSWLKSLGNILWNFEAMTMMFQKNGIFHTLQGL